jgi:hypothetical protein
MSSRGRYADEDMDTVGRKGMALTGGGTEVTASPLLVSESNVQNLQRSWTEEVK